MKVIRSDEKKIWTLVPTNPEEEATLRAISAQAATGDILNYGGSTREEKVRSKVECCVFHFRAKLEKRIKENGNMTITSHEYVGGITLILRGTTEADRAEVTEIAHVCYYGSSGMIFLKKDKLEDLPAFIFTAMHCPKCGRQMIDSLSCEWQTCDECAEDCEHKYEKGLVHGGGFNVGMDEVCVKCGRLNSQFKGDNAKTLRERHAAIKQELGITILPSDPAHSAQVIAELMCEAVSSMEV